MSDEMESYLIDIGDIAHAEIEHFTFALAARLGPEQATRWQSDLLNSISTLTQLPERYAVDPIDGPAFPGIKVRCLLYRNRSSVWRILYYIIEPTDEEQGVVRIIRFRNAAMRPLTEEEKTEE